MSLVLDELRALRAELPFRSEAEELRGRLALEEDARVRAEARALMAETDLRVETLLLRRELAVAQAQLEELRDENDNLHVTISLLARGDAA